MFRLYLQTHFCVIPQNCYKPWGYLFLCIKRLFKWQEIIAKSLMGAGGRGGGGLGVLDKSRLCSHGLSSYSKKKILACEQAPGGASAEEQTFSAKHPVSALAPPGAC